MRTHPMLWFLTPSALPVDATKDVLKRLPKQYQQTDGTALHQATGLWLSKAAFGPRKHCGGVFSRAQLRSVVQTFGLGRLLTRHQVQKIRSPDDCRTLIAYLQQDDARVCTGFIQIFGSATTVCAQGRVSTSLLSFHSEARTHCNREHKEGKQLGRLVATG